MTEHERALRHLVEQIRASNPIDDGGLWFKSNPAYVAACRLLSVPLDTPPPADELGLQLIQMVHHQYAQT